MTGSTGSPPPTAEQVARVALSRVVEPDDSAAMRFVHEQGPVAALEAATGGRAPVPGGSGAWGGEGNGVAGAAPPAVAGRREPRAVPGSRAGTGRRPRGANDTTDVPAWLRARRPTAEEACRDIETARRVGARLLCPGDKEWPEALAQLGPAAPLCLWARGPARLDAVAARAVAVVGSRAATGYGVHVAGEIAYGVARAGWTVVSGGAYGIDGAAHRGAIAADGVTVAVLACGVDVYYPRGHSLLFERVVESGLVVSEWPPGAAPFAYRFLARNRLIAALSAGTVVVEAAVRSGARNTATQAATLGRDVMAVPGPVTSAMSRGCHQLIRDGATCVTSAEEVVEALSPLGSVPAEEQRGPDDPRDGLPHAVRRVLEAVPVRRGRPATVIADAARCPLDEVRRALVTLEMAGFVERHEGGHRLSAVERARRRGGRR